MKKIVGFIKKETVLSIAWVLAIVSMLFVHPSLGYLDYIDFRSLGILLSLMIIMQVFKEKNVFNYIGYKLMSRTSGLIRLELILTALCFFSAMLITNDVALITFVPFSIIILEKCGHKKEIMKLVVLQTIAANMGSMMTPIGNPQNLYLYEVSGMGFGEFIKDVAPYTVAALCMLVVIISTHTGKNEKIDSGGIERETVTGKGIIAAFILLFVLAIAVVLRFVPYLILLVLTLTAAFIFDKQSLKKVDYSLIITFVGFFIFTGNVGSIPAIEEFLSHVVKGREFLLGITSSQVISNVPAALLISRFTDSYKELILSVNVGGLGTLIASMASLISYKIYANYEPENKGRYILKFTLFNILFLVVMVGLHLIWRG